MRNFAATALAAALAAASLSASAADITLYGVVDTALAYRSSSLDVRQSGVKTHKRSNDFTMDSGNLMANRWGIKGAEDLGSGAKVGFVLENGFALDDGTIGYGGRMFGRESQVYIEGSFGRLAAGRFGPFVSGNGSYAMLTKMAPYGNQIANYFAGTNAVMSYVGSRVDNAVTYLSPVFSGFQVRLQYSGGVDTTANAVENRSTADRYGAAALQFQNDTTYVGLIGDVRAYAANETGNSRAGYTATLGGQHNFGAFKLYAAGQYFANVKNSTFSAGPIKTFQSNLGQANANAFVDGFGLVAGADVPAAGGVLKLVAAYMDGDSNTGDNAFASDIDFERIALTVGYNYDLSKRTTLYSALGWQSDDVSLSNDSSVEEDDVKLLVGITHRF